MSQNPAPSHTPAVPFTPGQPGQAGVHTSIVIADSGNGQALVGFRDESQSNSMQTRLTADISTADIAAIQASQAEEKIRTHLSGLQKQARDIKTALEDASKSLETALLNWSSREKTPPTEGPASASPTPESSLMSALAPFDVPKLEAFYGPASIDIKRNLISARVGLQTKSTKSELHSRKIEDSIPVEIRSLHQSIEDLTRDGDNIALEIARARGALNNVDSIERRARSNVATAMLERSATGQAMLSRMEQASANADATSLINAFSQ